MANFTVNFTANTIGDHYICYRETAVGGAFTCTTENVTATGPVAVVIDVPFNLYCDVAILEGYIIAACQNQDDLNLDGFPDAAITFTVTMNQQIDPCPSYQIECTSAGVNAVTSGGGASGWTDQSHPLVFTDGTAITPATGVVTVAFNVFTILITDPGEYTVAPTTLDLSAFLATDPAGVAPTFAVFMLTCPRLDLRDYDCNGDSGVGSPQPFVILELNQTTNLCADPTAIATLDAQFTATLLPDTCNCIDCQGLYVTNAAGKTISVYYQTCWEGNDVNGYGPIVTNQVFVIDGETDLFIDCVTPGTVVLETSGVPGASFAYGPCDGSGPTP